MKRRKFITLLGGVAAAWPLAAPIQGRRRARVINILGALLTLYAGSAPCAEETRVYIEVLTGTYGASCGQSKGNVTAHLAASCNGKAACDYEVRWEVIGDPAYGCRKDYVAEWRCSGDPKPRSAIVPPEAGYGSLAHLSCDSRVGAGETKRIPPRSIASDVIFGTNLILNGDAEAGPGSPSAEKVETVPAWTTTGNFTVAQYGADSVKPDDPGPVDRGRNFFAGGPDNASSSAAQVIDVSAAAASIDRGEVVFNLAAYLGGWRQQNDRAVLTATFRDTNGGMLAQIILGPVTAVDRNSKSGLLPKSQAGMVPKGTRVISSSCG